MVLSCNLSDGYQIGHLAASAAAEIIMDSGLVCGGVNRGGCFWALKYGFWVTHTMIKEMKF